MTIRALSATLLTLLSLAAGRASATEFIVCNKGTVPLYAATAADESEFLISHAWRVSGWYEIGKGACGRLYDDTDPFYFAFSFKDSQGDWGAAQFEPERGDSVRISKENLCVARGKFEYTRGGGDPNGPCKDGYFRFAGTLVFYPDSDTSTFTLNVELSDRSRASPVNLQPLERSDPDGSRNARPGSESERTSSEEPTFFDKLAEIAAKAAADTLKETLENAIEHAADNPAPPSSAPTAPSSSAAVSTPSPPAERELHAFLFGAEIARQPFAGSPWIEVKSGSYVDVLYEVEGLASSDLFDAPTQRSADDGDVAAALATLNRGLASISGNRPARITSEGRLKYDFETQGGALSRHWVNVEALSFARARSITGRAGYTGFAIPCNGDNRCVISLDQDDAGKQSNHEILNEFDILFATEQDGRDVWAALQQLRNLYPAAPVVTAR
jgi:hypothetical protein